MKKILNIFASISLITAGASAVVACGSHHNPNPPSPPTPNPPKSEIQKLYDQLDGKKFSIQDNNFWGNEATYRQDLLADLEQKAGIKSQKEKSLLSLNSDLKTLDQQGYYNFVVGIGSGKLEKTAHVTIDWELTEAQNVPGLFDFYTKIWPQEVQDSQQDNGIPISKLFLNVWDKTKQTWPQNIKNTIEWSEFTNDLLNQRFQRAYNPLIPNNLQKYFHIQPNVENDSLKVNKYEKLRNPFYFQKSANDSKIYLPNYDFTQYNPFSPQNTLPKINQDWTVGYNTDYNLLEKNLKNIGTISLDQSQFVRGKQGGYYVDNNVQKDPIGFHNEQNILDYLNAQEGYTEIISNLTLKGEIIPGQVIPNKPKGSPIEVYYYGKDQGFPIYVYIS